MASLKDVELYLDGVRLGRITKDVGASERVGVPETLHGSQQPTQTHSMTGKVGAMISGLGDWGTRASTQQVSKDREVKWAWPTPKNLFTVDNVTSTSVHIRAEVIRWVYLVGSEKPKPMKKTMPSTGGGGRTTSKNFFASLVPSLSRPGSPAPRPSLSSKTSDQRKAVESSAHLTVFTAEAKVNLDNEMDKALKRATKKPAPPGVKVELIYVRNMAPAVIVSDVVFIDRKGRV